MKPHQVKMINRLKSRPDQDHIAPWERLMIARYELQAELCTALTIIGRRGPGAKHVRKALELLEAIR